MLFSSCSLLSYLDIYSLFLFERIHSLFFLCSCSTDNMYKLQHSQTQMMVSEVMVSNLFILECLTMFPASP